MGLEKTITFYVVAHADDWQLFMNPDAFNDITAPNHKVVIIVTTAGDAGMNEKYWRAREEAMKSSILFCLAPFGDVSSFIRTKNIDGKQINYHFLNNVIIYFLRLPDGGIDGNGFSSNRNQSLSKLHNSCMDQIASLDGSFCFKSWDHFCITLEKIILEECKNVDNIQLKYLNPAESKNPHDHADHKATGEAIDSFTNFRGTKFLFAGYGNSCNGTLSSKDIFWKTGMFAVYDKTVFDLTGYSTIGENRELYQKWCVSEPLLERVELMPK